MAFAAGMGFDKHNKLEALLKNADSRIRIDNAFGYLYNFDNNYSFPFAERLKNRLGGGL